MRTLCPSAFASVALACVVAATIDCDAADKPGVARISDSSNPAAEPNPLPLRTVSSSSTAYDHGGAACPAGYGNAGVCEGGYGGAYRNHSWLHHGRYRQTMRWDYVRGPAIHAIVREPVGYQRWLPDVWYGDPRYGVPEGFPIAPMIYMPTDTTQLGYYYQRVPTWIPKPHLLPPAPVPSRFHSFDWSAGLGGSCGNPHCECRNCRCGPNCGCGLMNGSTPATTNTPTPAKPGPKEDSNVPPKPKA